MEAGQLDVMRPTRGRTFVSFTNALIVLDGVAIASCLLMWHAYSAAPKNDSLAAGDDLGYALAALLFSGIFVVRELCMGGLLVSSSVRYARGRSGGQPQFSGATRTRGPRVMSLIVLTAIEIAAAYVWWRASEDRIELSSTFWLLAFTWNAAACAAVLRGGARSVSGPPRHMRR